MSKKKMNKKTEERSNKKKVPQNHDSRDQSTPLELSDDDLKRVAGGVGKDKSQITVSWETHEIKV